MSGLGAGSANAMAAYLVTATEAAGFALADAGLLVSLGSAVSIAARIALGWAADRWRPPLRACVTALMAGGALAYALLAGSGSWGVMVLATCLAFGMGWGWAGLSILAIVLPFLIRSARSAAHPPAADPPAGRCPWWGWCGLAVGAAAWVLAWTRFDWFAPLQAFTFLVPARYYVTVTRGIFLKGVGLEALWPQAVLMALYAILGLALATRTFRKELPE